MALIQAFFSFSKNVLKQFFGGLGTCSSPPSGTCTGVIGAKSCWKNIVSCLAKSAPDVRKLRKRSDPCSIHGTEMHCSLASPLRLASLSSSSSAFATDTFGVCWPCSSIFACLASISVLSRSLSSAHLPKFFLHCFFLSCQTLHCFFAISSASVDDLAGEHSVFARCLATPAAIFGHVPALPTLSA